MTVLGFLLFFIVFIVLPTINFLIRYSKEQDTNNKIKNIIETNSKLAQYSNNPEAFKILNRKILNTSDEMLKAFLSYEKLHIYLSINFINMIKDNARDIDLSYVLEEMELIRHEYNKIKNIDKLLFPAIIESIEGIKLFQEFQNKIQECELIGNIPKGYAYMAWSITLIAHINSSLNFYGPMLWNELKRGYEIYRKNTGKEWKQIPRF